MHRALIVAQLLLAAPLAHANEAPCPEGGPEALAAALEAYAQLDPEGFATSLADAEESFACGHQPPSSLVESQLLLARGLDAWLERDEVALDAAFDALVAHDPMVVPDPAWVPAGSGLERALDQARLRREERLAAEAEPPVVPEPVPVVDEAAAVDAALATAPAVQTERRGHGSWALLGAGLAVGVTSGASALVAQRAEHRFWATEVQGDAQQAYDLNRAAGFTAYGAAGISAGLVLGAVVVGRW